MTLYPNLPIDPQVVLGSTILRYPGEKQFSETGYTGAGDTAKVVEVKA